MRLIKAAIEQLRPATECEQLIHELVENRESGPWTMTKLTDGLGPHDYDDVSQDKKPEDADPEDIEMDDLPAPGDDDEELPPDEPQPGRRRLWGKRPMDTPAPSSTSRAARRGVPAERERPSAPLVQELPQAAPWQEDIPNSFWSQKEETPWVDESFAVAYELELPEGGKNLTRFCRDPGQFFIRALKRKAVEVSERRMDAEERKRFSLAKDVEVRKFLAAKAFENLPPDKRPNKSQALRMRWILTYKEAEDGSKKAKARAVVLGYMDPQYESRPTFAPTMTRNSRQLLLQLCAWKKFACYKGDVSGAFLQGRLYERELHCTPLPEICKGMGILPETVCRLRKACYGLVEAPIEWFETVNTFRRNIGYQQLRSDPCTWTYTQEGNIISAISAHVDDFLFAGREGCPIWEMLRKKIQDQFQWQEWEKDHFTQCGVVVNRKPDQSFELQQAHYLEGITEIPLSRDRRRQRSEETSDAEKGHLRALLGALSWHVNQVGYKYAAHVSLCLSEVPHSRVEHLDQANKLLHAIKQEGKNPLKIHAFDETEELCLVAWCDASSQNRHDGSSTEGILICMAPATIMEGQVARASPMFWRSAKIDRVCRSPGSAEARAAVDAEDNLFLMRYAWAELNGYSTDAWNPEQLVSKVLGVLVTDSRNVYDRVEKPYITPKGAQKKIDLELIALKESQQHTKLHVRWVNSDAQLANTLTKRGEEHQVSRFIALGQQWRIIHDPEMFSGKKRREKGLDPLASAEVP